MVKWKNIDFNTKGIVVEKTPTVAKGKKNIETFSIEGRSGVLTIDKGTYQTFNVSVECHAKDTVDFDDIKSFLDGSGTLSFDNEKEYTAVVNNSISFEKVLNFKSFLVQFLVNPIAHDITSTSYSVTSTPSTLTISGGNYTIEPTLTIVGSGDVTITINNETFNLDDLDSEKTYTLNSELKVITDNSGNNCSNKMQYDFPTLIPGENTISYTGTITTFTITYKKAYL